MSRGPDAGVRLERALVASAAQAGCTVTIADASWVRWASATFTGARHTLWLTGAVGPALDRWLADLPEAELPLRESLVADLAVANVAHTGEQARITLEALTVEV
ncbi:hypothetical protein AWL63_06790 [Sphingomonas panacis]|uniref:Uncharacterized protein n=1 Tax=Sphingomonas panacis TaxID=1560345 RepID=A0A1B3Z8G9_9SPHN|nr:hypothetical protein [Sphingomonas panacis]AOH83717.1 hypothetical protein AWL63_06790 [Sphingomonas panacis]